MDFMLCRSLNKIFGKGFRKDSFGSDEDFGEGQCRVFFIMAQQRFWEGFSRGVDRGQLNGSGQV